VARKTDLDLTSDDIARLTSAMQRARLVLRTPRQNRFDFVREFVGSRWSEEGARRDVPCNLIAAYVHIVLTKLIMHNPRYMLSTWSKKIRPVITAEEDWINKEVEKMQLVDSLQECGLDGLFSIGVMKVALAGPGDAALSGWQIKAGEPFAEPIDLDDFVYDIHCKKLREAGYMGHRYRVPTAVAKKMYGKKSGVEAQHDPLFNMEGDERIGVLGRTTLGGDSEEFEDFTSLWEVYIPRHKVVITLLDDQLTGASAGGDVKAVRGYGKALKIQKWLGPSTGPYHILGFGKVPGNPMPKAPVQDLYDLHISVNEMLRKLLREAKNYKSWTAVQGGADADGNRVMTVNDGEIIKVDNPEKIIKMESAVPNQQIFMLFESMRNLFSWLAGNLDVMGGLTPQGDTATQEKLLNANSSATIDEMQQRMVDFTASVGSALCWYWHHHPTKVMRSEYQAPGLNVMSVPRRVFPQGQGTGPMGRQRMARDHDWDDMEVKVDPYSLPHSTPSQRLQMMQQLVTSVFLPMAQLAQTQGISLDLHEFFSQWGKLTDNPEVDQLLTIGEPPPPQEQGGSGAPEAGPGPAETTRNYTRRSQGAQGPQNQILQQLQAGGGKQNGTPQPQNGKPR
jgi:hypothetical protein